MIALAMDTASMVHAIADQGGQQTTAHKKFAPTVALDMVNASMPLANAKPATLDLTALFWFAPKIAQTMDTATTEPASVERDSQVWTVQFQLVQMIACLEVLA